MRSLTRQNQKFDRFLIAEKHFYRGFITTGKFGCGIFIDLEKAFETFYHDILLHKMERLGIRGTALDWFQPYLNDHISKCFSKTTFLFYMLYMVFLKDLFLALCYSLFT